MMLFSLHIKNNLELYSEQQPITGGSPPAEHAFSWLRICPQMKRQQTNEDRCAVSRPCSGKLLNHHVDIIQVVDNASVLRVYLAQQVLCFVHT